MQSAILLMIASTVGVTVGWQPMPDGSPSYEYIVQLDRELLSTLKKGNPIPISSEVPDDIRPIARVRIAVGNERLPRQRLVTQFKPLTEGQSQQGVVETQYVVQKEATSAAPRYENQPILPADSPARPILPPNSRPATETNAFGQALQRSVEQARNASSGNPILPPKKEILPPATEILPPKNGLRYQDPIRTASQPDVKPWGDRGPANQASIEQLFGSAPEGNHRGNLQRVDERSIVTGGQNISPPRDRSPITSESRPILPPNSSTAANRSSTNTAEIRPANDSLSTGPRYREPNDPIVTNNPAYPSPLLPSKTPLNGISSKVTAPWPAPKKFEDAPLAQEWNTRNAADNRVALQPEDKSTPPVWPKTDDNTDSFDIASPARRGNGESSSSLAGSTPSDAQQPNRTPSTPEIRREMLSQPADDALRTASGDPVTPTPASFPASFPASSTLPAAASPQSTVIKKPPTTTDDTKEKSPGVQVFPLVLAWVLLSGSGAGNLYLFWSYLDIRNKYRGLIRTAGRKLGRHIDDEHDDEYDDDYED